MPTMYAPGTRTTVAQRPVFYRSAVRQYLAARLPKSAPIDALADDILRDVCDPEVLALFGRPFEGFRDRLLSVARLRLRLLPVQPSLWPLPPAGDEEAREFDSLYASALVSEAADAWSRTAEGRSPQAARAVRLHYREGKTVARTAEEMGVPAREVEELLQRARDGYRRHLLFALHLVCPTKEELTAELRHLILVLARGAR